jgi:hypothetical protein
LRWARTEKEGISREQYDPQELNFASLELFLASFVFRLLSSSSACNTDIVMVVAFGLVDGE